MGGKLDSARLSRRKSCKALEREREERLKYADSTGDLTFCLVKEDQRGRLYASVAHNARCTSLASADHDIDSGWLVFASEGARARGRAPQRHMTSHSVSRGTSTTNRSAASWRRA
uniref:Uncharacterized protein n=2 Tax=Plectus sambesii TaxID=2011161 RepID=A0A914W8H9_9BILA